MPKRKKTEAPPPEDVKPLGQIYTWGFCTHGQLGLKEKVLGAREYVEVPTHAAGPGSALESVQLITAACGHFHTTVVDNKGNAFTFGRDDRGQLGRGGDDDDEDILDKRGAVPRRVKSLSSTVVIDVSCGAFHCLVLTSERTLISWGWNKYGQLGRPTLWQCDASPGYVLEARDARGPVRSFAAGFGFSAAVLFSGHVLAWGSNEYGQLGVGLGAVKHPEVATTPLLVPGVVGAQVAAGDNHLLVLTNEGNAMAAGDAAYGQTGIEEDGRTGRERNGKLGPICGLFWKAADDDEEAQPKPQDDVVTERVRYLAAGGATSAAITTKGKLFTWGGGVWGQLGHGDRNDRTLATPVETLPRAIHVDVAQDHMLAVCTVGSMRLAAPAPAPPPPTTRSERPLQDDGFGMSVRFQRDLSLQPATVQGPKPTVEARAEEKQADELGAGGGPKAGSSLWVWGRKKLLPTGLGTLSATQVDKEAQKVPLEVPSDMLGPLAKQCFQGANDLRVRAACGGAHSIALVIEEDKFSNKKKFDASWCPKLATVTGQGTKGGLVSEGLGFVITTRNEEGRDEKIGGLRFRVWAVPEASVQGRSRATASSPKAAVVADKLLFDLQWLRDCKDGTYEGCYSLRKPGRYLLHVHMLRPDADAAELVEPPTTSTSGGEPIAGSPFKVSIASGPAFARHCDVKLKSGGATTTGSSGSGSLFVLEACREATFSIAAHDVLRHLCTSDAACFEAYIDRIATTMAVPEAPEAEADGGSPMSKSLSDNPDTNMQSISAILRERVRKRKEERQFARTMTAFKEMTAKKKTEVESTVEHLRVRGGKEPWEHLIKWTPNIVGKYKLHISLLGRTADDRSEPVDASPVDVEVIAGKPSAEHSQMLVCGKEKAGESPLATLVGQGAEIPFELHLSDRMGNKCPLSADPLKDVTVRVENVALFAESIPEAKPLAGHGPPWKMLDWKVEQLPRPAIGAALKPHQLKLVVKPAAPLHKASHSVAAAASKGGGDAPPNIDGTLIVQFFLSASDSKKHERLRGSPFRIRVTLPLPPTESKPASAPEAASLGTSTAADVEAGVQSPQPAGPVLPAEVAASQASPSSEHTSCQAPTSSMRTPQPAPQRVPDPLPASPGVSEAAPLADASKVQTEIVSRQTKPMAGPDDASSSPRPSPADALGHLSPLLKRLCSPPDSHPRFADAATAPKALEEVLFHSWPEEPDEILGNSQKLKNPFMMPKSLSKQVSEGRNGVEPSGAEVSGALPSLNLTDPFQQLVEGLSPSKPATPASSVGALTPSTAMSLVPRTPPAGAIRHSPPASPPQQRLGSPLQEPSSTSQQPPAISAALAAAAAVATKAPILSPSSVSSSSERKDSCSSILSGTGLISSLGSSLAGSSTKGSPVNNSAAASPKKAATFRGSRQFPSGLAGAGSSLLMRKEDARLPAPSPFPRPQRRC
eukprot:TRINITY_DN47380_c0_g1_i1.p1 TRINITY_DN47380_c0_g1~~TRINITY_DN47380_c0_g1_i1.p1  ORF type:complete len:1441 (-),score=298.02 TRINITY_DN47380_c0_g1_i1:221-4543(-)